MGKTKDEKIIKPIIENEKKTNKTVKKTEKSKDNKSDFELIVTEKPKSALKIAQALTDSKIDKESINTVPVYSITHNKHKIMITSAVGHLFTLSEKKSSMRHTLPVFDVEWTPIYEKNKKSDYTKKYIDTLKLISKKHPAKVYIATDYDIEGEVIGLNVVRYALNLEDAHRMKFSTLTKNDLVTSYDSASKNLDWGQALAGETRHTLDWYYGINLSRMLTNLLRENNVYKQLSVGRVQGPTLKVIVEKEKEITAFIPKKYWEITIKSNKDGDKNIIEAIHKDERIFEKEKAEKIYNAVKNEKKGTVKEVKKSKLTQMPPHPFDLTTLQTEAYRTLKIKPKHTLDLAQELYIGGFISYPRTSSQILPPNIGYKNILNQLKKNSIYAKLCEKVLKKDFLKPNNGLKEDPAHPAIYPTGIIPDKVDAKAMKLYDLIVKRFIATFGDNAIRENVNLNIDVKNEIFIAKGVTTLEKGWHELYEPYTSFKDSPLPLINQNDCLNIKKIDNTEKETEPARRYTESSIIKELEKRNLGTKATRANIIETLYQRKYIEGSPIKATELGIKTVELLEKYSPLIVDESLTRQFEENLEKIREKSVKPENVLDDAKKTISKIIEDFKKNKSECSGELFDAEKIAEKEANTFAKCPLCENGKAVLRKGKFGPFIACNNYPNCKYTFNIPSNSYELKETEDECEKCHKLLITFKAGKGSQKICINPECPENKEKQELKKIPPKKIDRKCPKCNHDLLLRNSIYGEFIACSNFPKCRYTEKINGKANNIETNKNNKK